MSENPRSPELLLHVVNVDHGDAMILELPPYRDAPGLVHFGVVDAGRPEYRYRHRLSDYMKALIDLRGCADSFEISFVCITHPHEDHYGGLETLLEDAQLAPRIRQFWDCGFRTTSVTYNKLLDKIARTDHIVYDRLASGFECEMGDVRIDVLAPSIDLRNRFDTFGVDRNNASVVLRIQYRHSVAVLAGDAFLDSWGKVAEEFPRTTRTIFARGVLPQRSEGSNQLRCQLLKLSHHGSKHGTSLELLEKLAPHYAVATCGPSEWYRHNEPNWGDRWPHPLTLKILRELRSLKGIHTSAKHGNVVYHLTGRARKSIYARCFKAVPGADEGFRRGLRRAVGTRAGTAAT